MNKKTHFGLVGLTVILITISSCQKDDTFNYVVDAPLQDYFDRFASAAAARGVLIDYESLRISGSLRIIAAAQVIGQCIHSDKEPNTVVIDRLYWTHATDLEKEFLVFHELGHCALHRGHTDHSNGQGDCISIMTSGTGICKVNYTASNRESLLDELFMP